MLTMTVLGPAALGQLPSLPDVPKPDAAPKVAPGLNLPPRGPGAVRPFPEEVDGRTAVPAAMARAKAASRHVLVIWGQNGSSFAAATKSVMDARDVTRMISREFEPIWLNIREGVFAEDNRSLTEAYQTQIKPTDPHAVLQVLDDKGVPVGQASFQQMLDKHRSGQFSPLKVLDFLTQNTREQPSAETLLAQATERAKASGRSVLVRFYEMGEPWAERFEQLLTREDVRSILEKRFELLQIDMVRNPGGPDLMARFSANPESYPWYLVLNVDGLPIAMSQPVGKSNIGFPTSDAEIDAFLEFVRSGSAPAPLSESDRGILKSALAAMRGMPAAAPAKP